MHQLTLVDVYSHSRTNDGFPHDSTTNQWFDESQFESYRRLGLEIVEHLFPQDADPTDIPFAPGGPALMPRAPAPVPAPPPPACAVHVAQLKEGQP